MISGAEEALGAADPVPWLCHNMACEPLFVFC